MDDGVVQPTSRLNKFVDAGTPPLILTDATMDVDWTRATKYCRSGKRKHEPIRRGAVKLCDAVEARKRGLQKKRKRKSLDAFLALITAAGTAIAFAKLRPARRTAVTVLVQH